MNQAAVKAEIHDILEHICHTHKLPLALTWVSSNSNNNSKRILRIEDTTSCFVNDLGVQGFVKACAGHPLEDGQGVAGKALKLMHHYFVPNVTLLDVADYPCVNDAKNFGLGAALAIKIMIKSEFNRCNVDYVLEFFLPKDMDDSMKQRNLMDEILASLRRGCENSRTVRAHGYNIQPVRLFGVSNLSSTSTENNCENSRAVSIGEGNGAGSGYKIQPVSLFGNSNLNQTSPEKNCENSMELSIVELNGGDGYNVQPISVSRSLLLTREQEVGEQNTAVELAHDNDNQLARMNGSQLTNGTIKRRRISEVWTAFDKVQEENGAVWAICKACNKKYPGESKKGTSNLHKHMRKCFRDMQRDTEQQTSPFIGTSHFNQERSRMDIARMVIKHGYPLNIVEHEFFEIFVGNLQPMFKCYSHEIVEADVHVVYREEREKLSKYLDSLSCCFSLAIDLQSYDDRKVTCCCLTLHFIDNGWELKKKILAFKTLEYNCGVETLHEVIESVLMEWNIDKNVQFIYTKIMPPNEQMVGELKGRLSDQVLPHSGDLFYSSCCAQILNLLVQDGFHEISSVLGKIRDTIEYVSGPPLQRQKFHEAVTQLKVQDNEMVSQDVPTRWDTTFLMLERALELQKVFTYLEQVDGDYKANPSIEEWKMANVICECLKVFHKAMCNSSTSIDVYFENICFIYTNLGKWEKSEHKYICSMAHRMKVKFDEYWHENSLASGIVAVLDPRFKFDLLEYGYEQIYSSDSKLHLWRFHHDLTRVYNKYANGSSYLGSSALTATHVTSASYSPNSDDKVYGFNQWRKRKYDSSAGDSRKSELDQYLEQPPINLGMDSDILAWWRANALNFPTLAKMARDFLAIPISAILLKSSFIDEVMKMNPFLIGLSPETVETLVCGQDWLESPKRR